MTVFVNPLLNSDTATALGDKLAFEYESTLLANGEGNGSPLQYCCLESPVDGGAWSAAVHRVAQSQTQLKRLSMHALLSSVILIYLFLAVLDPCCFAQAFSI